MTRPRDQVMPDLSAEEYTALHDSIREQGVLVPLVYDGEGNLLDGHHRLRACDELGVTSYPSQIVPGLDAAEKRTLSRELNCQRRHLSQKQRRELIADQLRDTPNWADNRIAGILGVSDHTVAAVRAELESTSQIAKSGVREGADGKARSARRPVVLASDERQRNKILAEINELEEIPPDAMDRRGLTRAVERQRLERQSAQLAEDKARTAEFAEKNLLRLPGCPVVCKDFIDGLPVLGNDPEIEAAWEAWCDACMEEFKRITTTDIDCDLGAMAKVLKLSRKEKAQLERMGASPEDMRALGEALQTARRLCKLGKAKVKEDRAIAEERARNAGHKEVSSPGPCRPGWDGWGAQAPGMKEWFAAAARVAEADTTTASLILQQNDGFCPEARIKAAINDDPGGNRGLAQTESAVHAP